MSRTTPLHAELVVAGHRFLSSLGCTRIRECQTVELYDGRKVWPDLHGDGGSVCAVVEAKASRADLMRSVPKYESIVRPHKGWSPLAQVHYVIVPAADLAWGLIPFGWGLLEWDKVLVEAPSFRCNMKRSGNGRCPAYGAGGEKALETIFGTDYREARARVRPRVIVPIEDEA